MYLYSVIEKYGPGPISNRQNPELNNRIWALSYVICFLKCGALLDSYRTLQEGKEPKKYDGKYRLKMIERIEKAMNEIYNSTMVLILDGNLEHAAHA